MAYGIIEAVDRARAMQAQGGASTRIADRNELALEQGIKEGESKAGEITADIDYKKLAEEELARKKAIAGRGLTAAEAAPVKQNLRSASRAARAAMAGAGIRGGTAAQVQAGLYGGAQQQMAAMDAALRNKSEEDYLAAVKQQQYLRLSLPLAYGKLQSGAYTTAAQTQMASQPAPQQKTGLLTKMLGPLL